MKRWSSTCRLLLGLLLVVGISWQTVFRTMAVVESKTVEIHVTEASPDPKQRKQSDYDTSSQGSATPPSTSSNTGSLSEPGNSEQSSDQSGSEQQTDLSQAQQQTQLVFTEKDKQDRALFSRRSVIPIESEFEPLPGPICNFTGDCCKPFTANDTLVWDSFTFSGDWEMLQLRLGTHCNIVHQFVVLQANITFGGEPNAYAYPNDTRIAPWANCIRFVTTFSTGKVGAYVEVKVSSVGDTSEAYDASPWPVMNERDAVEIWMRDNIHYGYTTHDKTSLIGVGDDDWVIFSDLDEICNPQATQWLLKYYTGNPWFVLHFAEFAYGFWNQKASHDAAGASIVRGRLAKYYRMAAVYFHGRRGGSSESGKCRKPRQASGLRWATWNKKPIDTACMWKRAKLHPRKVYAMGWHCSNCFPSIERILKKLCSFKWMHALLVERGWNMKTFTSAVLSGRVVHSTSQRHMSIPYVRVDGPSTAPEFARAHRDRFKYLLSPNGIAVDTHAQINNCGSLSKETESN